MNQTGVALFIVLAAMATLAIFVSEITYTAQINQKLAYDRLDQVKAQALAKSGLRLALMRIKAYTELKKTISKLSGASGASADAVSSVVPKAVLEKIWAEPITIPFTGDISSLPSSVKDSLLKFRKDSGMEGKLYISIQAQANKFNLNSTLPSFAAAAATPTPKPAGAAAGAAGAAPTSTPAAFDPLKARELLVQQLKQSFAKKSETDEKFRDAYHSYRIEDLAEDILGYGDLSYESPREQYASIPFKKAPFYNVSELHYLQSMDDQIYDLLSDQFTAGTASFLNVNKINEPVLRALVPQMTDDEVKKFFDFRDSTGEAASNAGAPVKNASSGDDNSFKTVDDFYKYLKEKVQLFAGSDSKITDFKTALTSRGIQLTTEENNFLVHIEATVQQTKKTLEAMVSLIDTKAPVAPAPGVIAAPTPLPMQSSNVVNNGDTPVEKSNIKITQLRFL